MSDRLVRVRRFLDKVRLNLRWAGERASEKPDWFDDMHSAVAWLADAVEELEAAVRKAEGQ